MEISVNMEKVFTMLDPKVGSYPKNQSSLIRQPVYCLLCHIDSNLFQLVTEFSLNLHSKVIFEEVRAVSIAFILITQSETLSIIICHYRLKNRYQYA